MGFEQLAELRKQLAKEARAAKEQAQPAEADKSARPARPGQRDGKGERDAKGQRDARGQRDRKGPHEPKGQREAQGQRGERRGHPAPKGEPVDPVVRVIGKLQKRFPAAFPKNPAPKVPLKIGVLTDLLSHAEELALSEAQIREAVSTWCRGSRYWACLVDGAARVDLEGAPAGSVTARDAAFARRQAKGGAAARRKGDGVRPPAKAEGEPTPQQGTPDALPSSEVAAQSSDHAQSSDATHSADTTPSSDTEPTPSVAHSPDSAQSPD
jgi:ProP effector